MAWMKRFWKSLEWELLLAVLLALPLMLAYLPEGLPPLADSEIHLHRIISASVLQEAGFAWGRWTPYLHHGFGYPIHNFYAPGLHLLGGILLRLTNADAIIVWKMLAFGAILLYPIGSYLFAGTFAGRKAALVAAIAYTYAPMRFHEIFLQGNLSQLAAMGMLPWVFWRTVRLVQTPTPRNVAWLGAAFAAVILLHHPTGYLVAPFGALLGMCLCVGRGTRQLPTLVVTALGYVLGLGLAAVFWLPALAEFQYVQISSVQSGMFNPTENLIALTALLRSFGNTTDATNFHAIGQVQFALACLAPLVGWALWRRNHHSVPPMLGLHIVYAALCLLLCTFLMTPAAAWFWQNVSIGMLIVFPWRLLGITALMSIAAAAFFVEIVPLRWRNAAVVALAVGLIGSALPLFRMPDTYITLPDYTPSQAIVYEQRTGNMGLTSGNEYLPIWAIERPQSVDPGNHVLREFRVDPLWSALPMGFAVTRITDNCPKTVTCYTYTQPQDATLLFNQLYFPGWRVTIDTLEVPTRPETPQGLIAVDLPAGAHTLTITYDGTPVQHLSEALSLLCVLLSVLLIVSPWGFIRQLPRKEG